MSRKILQTVKDIYQKMKNRLANYNEYKDWQYYYTNSFKETVAEIKCFGVYGAPEKTDVDSSWSYDKAIANNHDFGVYERVKIGDALYTAIDAYCEIESCNTSRDKHKNGRLNNLLKSTAPLALPDADIKDNTDENYTKFVVTIPQGIIYARQDFNPTIHASALKIVKEHLVHRETARWYYNELEKIKNEYPLLHKAAYNFAMRDDILYCKESAKDPTLKPYVEYCGS
ncbi:MAG: hypothetical protein ACP5NV_06535 [Candidatus Woesearchaeota archaeon]